LKQVFRDLWSFCRAPGGCSPPAAALEDGPPSWYRVNHPR
jgi:hypothetical protein